MTGFLTEPEPERGIAQDVAPGIRRLTAANPGPMTYHGTNTYFVHADDGLTILDPGPADPAHLRAILANAAGTPIRRILLSHHHHDHTGNALALKAAIGAPIAAFAENPMPEITADEIVPDGGTVAGMHAIHTPGHAADHLCLACPDGVVFTADHVMSWSTSVVGDMSAYFASLHRLLSRAGDNLFLPGHGPPLPDPRPYLEMLLAHRQQREQAIAAALTDEPQTPSALVAAVYGNLAANLRAPAERSLISHLEKLEKDSRAVRVGTGWRRA